MSSPDDWRPEPLWPAPTDRFEASRLKVWRARQHIKSFSEEIAAYIARNPITYDAWPAPAREVRVANRQFRIENYCHFQINIHETPPKHLPAIIGDIIHNLRTALDLLASDLVRLNGNDPKNVYFPFAESAAQIEVMIKHRNMHLAAPPVVDLLRSFKPYKGGNIALRGIHDLDVRDKHQMLIPAAASIDFPYGGLGYPNVNKMEVGTTGPSGRSIQDPSSLGMGQIVRFELVFSWEIFSWEENSPFSGPMVPVFERLADETLGIVHAFETLCFGAIAVGDW